MSTHVPAPPTPTQANGRRPRRRRWLIALITTLGVIALGAGGVFFWLQQQQQCVKAPDPTRSGAISEYCPPERYGPLSGAMTSGPDGNLWYVDSQGKIARFTLPSGAITEFAAPTAPNQVAYGGMVRGADGNIWYVANYTLGRVSMTGASTEFALPKNLGLSGGIAAGPDGTLWLTMGANNPDQKGALLKVTPPKDGATTPTIAEVPLQAKLQANTHLGYIATASDGSLWASTFVSSGDTTQSTDFIRITPAGAITQIPATISGAVTALAAGSDGAMWFISASWQGQTGEIGRVSPTGDVTVFRVSEVGQPGSQSLALGPDGNLWFSTKDGGIARITPSGKVTTFSLPHTGGLVAGITAGPDGGVWFLLGYPQPFQPTSRFVRITP